MDSKSFAIKTIMSDPKLSKAILDSWLSPVGSTKNKKASAIMKSLEMTSRRNNMDGKGGAIDYSAIKNVAGNMINPFLNTAYNQIKKGSSALLSGNKEQTPNTVQPSGNDYVPPKESIFSENYISESPTTKTSTGYVFLKPIPSDWTPIEESTSGMPTSDITPSTQDYSQPIQDSQTPQDYSQTPQDYSKNVSLTYQDALNNYGISTATDMTGINPDLAKAVESGVGRETFAQQALVDKEMLAGILNIPKEALDWLPEGGFLSDYLDDLKEQTKKQYQLDTQLDRLLKMENAGANVEGDLTNYIKGKDQYLGQLDKLYDTASTQISNMDLSDPSLKKRMGNYLNYLTILKGRQNQRYIDYLNNSVKEFDAKLERMSNLYQYSKEKFDEDYADLKDGATEKYNSLKTMLTEQYDNVASREEEDYNSSKRKLDLIASSLAITQATIENQRLQDEISGVTAPKEFYSRTSTSINELQQGADWGTIWNRIKMEFPNISNEQIDTALGGGIVNTEEEARNKDPNRQTIQVADGKWAWGYAKPGAYQDFKSNTGSTSSNEPSKEQKVGNVITILSVPQSDESYGLPGWKDLPLAEQCANIRAYGLNPKDIGEDWDIACASVSPPAPTP